MVIAVYKTFAVLLILPFIHMVCVMIVPCINVETFSPLPLSVHKMISLGMVVGPEYA